MVLYIHHGQWRKLQQLLILQASQKCTRWDVISQTCFALTKEDTDKTVCMQNKCTCFQSRRQPVLVAQMFEYTYSTCTVLENTERKMKNLMKTRKCDWLTFCTKGYDIKLTSTFFKKLFPFNLFIIDEQFKTQISCKLKDQFLENKISLSACFLSNNHDFVFSMTNRYPIDRSRSCFLHLDQTVLLHCKNVQQIELNGYHYHKPYTTCGLSQYIKNHSKTNQPPQDARSLFLQIKSAKRNQKVNDPAIWNKKQRCMLPKTAYLILIAHYYYHISIKWFGTPKFHRILAGL
jgi:hypothetical protein